MDFDDDDIYEASGEDERTFAANEKDHLETIDPLDVSDPSSAYLFLSDDVQDKLAGKGNRRKMKCLNCGTTFKGDILDVCPKCSTSNTVRAY